MINVIYALVWLVPLWKWGDWKNWKKYYPTILFFVMGDLLYMYLLSDHYPMWKYNPPDIDRSINLTNTHISLSIMLIKYPTTILIYLSRFPKDNRKKQLLYILCWVGIYVINEIIDLKFKLIKYYNGWSIWWSILFNTVLFIILRFHYRNPILGWTLSICFIVFLWYTFEVPSSVFR